MKKLLTLLLMSNLMWADFAIEPLAVSYHYDRDKDYNENHKYLGLVYRYNNFEIGASTMENSYYKRSNSIYIGYLHPLYKEGDFMVGLFGDVGYQTGYDRSDLLLYGGLYTEYKNFYIKTGGSTIFIGAVIGYRFKSLFKDN